jgi:Flp pilus assembly protein TadG
MRRQRDSKGTATAASKRSRKGQRGQSLVELSFMLPVLLIVVFGIIDFGMGLRSYISLTNATREGARYASVGSTAGTYPTNCNGTTGTTVIGRVCVTVQPLKVADMQSVTVTYPTGQGPGKSVVVAATYRYNFVTPVGAFIHFFTGGTFPTYLTLTASSNMRQE